MKKSFLKKKEKRKKDASGSAGLSVQDELYERSQKAWRFDDIARGGCGEFFEVQAGVLDFCAGVPRDVRNARISPNAITKLGGGDMSRYVQNWALALLR